MAGSAFCKLQPGLQVVLFEDVNGPGEMADASEGGPP
jgi:hypothetical protein